MVDQMHGMLIHAYDQVYQPITDVHAHTLHCLHSLLLCSLAVNLAYFGGHISSSSSRVCARRYSCRTLILTQRQSVILLSKSRFFSCASNYARHTTTSLDLCHNGSVQDAYAAVSASVCKSASQWKDFYVNIVRFCIPTFSRMS